MMRFTEYSKKYCTVIQTKPTTSNNPKFRRNNNFQPSINNAVACTDRQKMIDSFKLRALKQLHTAQYSTTNSFQQITTTPEILTKQADIAPKIPAVSLPTADL